ncbi:tyrosine-type recombinase/integrase [Hyphomonas sp.]|uniref:tyrosine-type recombinase/integrase n=1 Tax=Hyphomonas sp. TaxID=87 RepID=UPI003F6E6C92
MNRLNAKQVKDPMAEGLHADGGGLWLNVTKKGSKSWRFIYRWNGKRPELGLGTYPAVSLADARRRAEEARSWLASKPKRDPKDLFKPPPLPPESKTFGEFTEAFLDQILPDFRNPKHQQQWRNTLKTYAAKLWKIDIAEIETHHVLEALQPIWSTKRETGRRVRGRIERILDAAKAQGLRTGENPARWRGHLSTILPDQKKARKHHAAMPFDSLPTFMEKIRADKALSARALELVILTATRSSEARGATWNEIDLEQRIWTIPAGRMKANRAHRIPLSAPAMRLLRALGEDRRGDFVLPGLSSKKHISETSLYKALARHGACEFTVHGFRSTFRDWAGERTNFPREVAEQSLAHVVGDETERAYRRGDALEKRRTLMDAWAQFCGTPAGGSVVALHG